MDKWLSVETLGELLGISGRKVGKHVRYREADVVAWLNEREPAGRAARQGKRDLGVEVQKRSIPHSVPCSPEPRQPNG